MSDTSKIHLLTEMYPYDITNKKNAALRKGLQEYKFFLEALKETITHFQNGHLERFDCLVGENACQIRAIKIAIIASKKDISFECLVKQVDTAAVRVSQLLEPKNIDQLMRNEVHLNELLKDKKLKISLNYEQFFLLQSFILTEIKTKNESGATISSLTLKEKSDPQKLKRLNPNVSYSFASSLINKTRTKVAESSVNYVRKKAKSLNEPSLILMSSKDATFEHNTLQSQPMYWTYKTLLKAAESNSIPLVFHAQFVKRNDLGYEMQGEEILYFKQISTLNESTYIQTNFDEFDSSRPACIVKGFVVMDAEEQIVNKATWIDKMTKQSITDILLASAADHRQYPNREIETSALDNEYIDHKLLAKNNGFSFENPNTFFVNHVFPMQIGRTASILRNA